MSVYKIKTECIRRKPNDRAEVWSPEHDRKQHTGGNHPKDVY